MQSPPSDPLSQSVGMVAHPQPPNTGLTNPYAGRVNPYSNSELVRQRTRLGNQLFYTLVTFVLLGLALVGYIYLPKIYNHFFNDPNLAFDRSLENSLSVESEFYSLESSGSLGILSAQQDRDGSDFYNPKSSGKLQLDLLLDKFNIDANIEYVATSQETVAANLTKYEIFADGKPLDNAKTSLVANKWVELPSVGTSDEDSFTLIFLGSWSELNTVFRPIPAGMLNQSDLDKAKQLLAEHNPYQRDCYRTDKYIKCSVSLDRDALSAFYSELTGAKISEIEYFASLWPKSMTVYINPANDQISEIRYRTDSADIKIVAGYNQEHAKIVEPVGALKLDEFRQFAKKFEASL